MCRRSKSINTFQESKRFYCAISVVGNVLRVKFPAKAHPLTSCTIGVKCFGPLSFNLFLEQCPIFWKDVIPC